MAEGRHPALRFPWGHLVARFFGFITARPLSPREQAEVRALLSDRELELFWQQRPEDQRHALDVARRALLAMPGDRELARAGLLHDIGKRNVRLGALQRSIATVLDGLGFTLRGSYEAYRRHGPLGAADLESVGSPELAVEFARRHPGGAPENLDRDRWQVLIASDRG